MAYATVEDVQSGMINQMSERQQEVCEVLLDRAALIIDKANEDADAEIKKSVSCTMVQRALESSTNNAGIPFGASQGSMSGLGFAQSWTMSSGGMVGDLYLSKQEKKLLGVGNRIGSYSPVEELVK